LEKEGLLKRKNVSRGEEKDKASRLPPAYTGEGGSQEKEGERYNQSSIFGGTRLAPNEEGSYYYQFAVERRVMKGGKHRVSSEGPFLTATKIRWEPVDAEEGGGGGSRSLFANSKLKGNFRPPPRPQELEEGESSASSARRFHLSS